MSYRAALQLKELICVHRGCGQVHYIPGWLNVDTNIFSESPDVWAKLMGPATLLQDSVNMFNSHHMIEHLLDRFLASHFRDMYECLISGGGIRVGGPGIGSACREFVEGGLDWFSSMKPISRPSWGAISRISSFVAASI